MNAKDLYRELWTKEPSIPIFSRGWWLDATAGEENWDVALVRHGNQVMAAMPYMLRRRYGMKVLSQPSASTLLDRICGSKSCTWIFATKFFSSRR